MKPLMILSALILFAACSDSPDAPSGSLPIVQNCRILETESKGDTVYIAWDAVNVEVDGYRVWFSDTDPGDWTIIAQVDSTVTVDIATRTGYYCVDAIKGIDSSEDQSAKANDRANMYLIDDTLTIGGNNGLQFQESYTAIGNAAEATFAQDLYIAKSGDTILFYSGNSDPALFPGGAGAMIAPSSNYLAPGTGDAAWKTSAAAQNTSGFFVELTNGHYAHFQVDTVATDFVVLNSSQYQSIPGLRLFNTFIF